MSFSFRYPDLEGVGHDFVVEPGNIVFLLGANGSGKSGLLQLFANQNRNSFVKVSAHRPSWMETGFVSTTATERSSHIPGILNHDIADQARWRDGYQHHRSNHALFDFVNLDNIRARKIAGYAESKNFEKVAEISAAPSPTKTINELFKIANVPIQIEIIDGIEVRASRQGGESYSIAEMSDGERNIFILSATVLAAKEETLFLIDEPEKHLHRSNISPLITKLVAMRPDCGFVISTHEVNLPIDNPGSKIMLVRGSINLKGKFQGWDVDVISSTFELPDTFLTNILGQRRKIIFVEGANNSLDRPLYELIFPAFSIVSKDGFRNVENAARAANQMTNMHWLDVYGIVDNDRRSEDTFKDLSKFKVFALPVFTIESVYFHPQIFRLIAFRQAAVTGDDPNVLIEISEKKALEIISAQRVELCTKVVEGKIREEVYRLLPDKAVYSKGDDVIVKFSISTFWKQETERFDDIIKNRDLASLVTFYPIHKTSAFGSIAKNLGFKSSHVYCKAVLKLLKDDDAALSTIKKILSDLINSISKE